MEDAARDGPCARGEEFSNHLIQLLSASLLSFSQVKPKRRACARGSNRTPCSHSRSAHVGRAQCDCERNAVAHAPQPSSKKSWTRTRVAAYALTGDARLKFLRVKFSSREHMHKKDAAPHDGQCAHA